MAVQGAATAVLAALVATAPPHLATSPRLDVVLRLALFLLAAGLAALALAPLAPRSRAAAATAILGLFLAGTVLLTLKPTPYALNGVSVDQGYYTTFITRFAASGWPQDSFYKGLPPFYPPLFFYLLGRAAAWFNLPAYSLMKWGLVAVAAFAPLLIERLWRPLVGRPGAVAVASGTIFFQIWDKPAEWLSLVLFVPWWLLFVVDAAGHAPRAGARRRGWLLGGGLLGALLFTIYYYWFFVGAVGLGTCAALAWAVRRTGSAPPPAPLRQSLAMLATTALLSLPYWGPYLASMAATGGWTPLQNRWLSEGKIPLPFPFFDDSLEGLFLAAGLGFLLVSYRSNRVAFHLLSLLLAVYGWTMLGYAGILTDRPLLTFRAFPMIDLLLATATLLALAGAWQEGWHRRLRLPDATPVAALALLLLLYFGQERLHQLAHDEYVTRAIETAPPTALLDDFQRLTGQGRRDLVVLTDQKEIGIYLPVYNFLAWSAHYSHPAGRFYDRVDFLTRLGEISSPALIAAALRQNRYSPIDHLFLRAEGSAYTFTYTDDNFPNRTIERTIRLSQPHLAAPHFSTHPLGDATLLTPRPEAVPAAPTLADQAARYALAVTFGSHLVTAPGAAELAALEATLASADLTELPLPLLLDLQRAQRPALAAQVRAALDRAIPRTLDRVLTDGAGSPRLRLLGHTLHQPEPGAAAILTLYIEVLAPLAEDYTLWVHGQRGGAQENYDHLTAVPTTRWQPGRIVAESTIIPTPVERIAFGFWQSESGARLTGPDGNHEIDLGALTLR